MREFLFKDDKYQMNWIEGNTGWGTVKAPDGIAVESSMEKIGEDIVERYKFINTTNKDIFTSLTDISIYVPFNDDYVNSRICLTNRCHTHIWCGEDVTYIMALRMGGEAPHLGLVLTEGSIGGYSVERDENKLSNDRGDFILHPSPVSLVPGGEFVISWRLFRHNGKEDFYGKLGKLCPRYLHVTAENYVVFQNERIHVDIVPVFDFADCDVSIVRDGKKVDFTSENGVISINEIPECCGEYSYEISVRNVKTHCNILVQPELSRLARLRCHFIADRQQYHNEKSRLDGAYLIYDNEEKHMYYHVKNDYNGARERIGMGLMLAKYLQHNHDDALKNSLKKYIQYVERELFDEESGMVYNDYQRDNSYFRLYNFPWVSLFFLEIYDLSGDKKYLVNAYKAVNCFYEQGGIHFYAIEIPIVSIIQKLNAGGMGRYAENLVQKFRMHSDYIISQGLQYPAHEVNFEQSISAPAASILIQTYKVTGEEKYLAGAKEQAAALELFHGLQPDYHMYEAAIRHWDGYWFGKRQMYGDTYPHYWTALTANVYEDLGVLMNDKKYLRKAEAAYRAVLSLFKPDGSASCAYIYPVSVNGEKAAYYDEYANDQDWGLYFMLRHMYDTA